MTKPQQELDDGGLCLWQAQLSIIAAAVLPREIVRADVQRDSPSLLLPTNPLPLPGTCAESQPGEIDWTWGPASDRPGGAYRMRAPALGCGCAGLLSADLALDMHALPSLDRLLIARGKVLLPCRAL